jgi:hypothetical protein
MCFIELVDYNELMLKDKKAPVKAKTRRSRRKADDEVVAPKAEAPKAPKKAPKAVEPVVETPVEEAVVEAPVEEVAVEAVAEELPVVEEVAPEVEATEAEEAPKAE